jgi:hypothetical protein
LNTVLTLNRLLALLGGSLPMYLVSAPPHRQHGEEIAWEVLRHIIDDQKLMIDKIADYIESIDGTPNMGEFPMEFTGMHDLSMDYILQQVLKRQKNEVALIEHLSEQLKAGSQARALAQESLGAAKAHVQSIEESIASMAA